MRLLSRLCRAFGLGPRRAPLATAAAARRFAFERLALKRSHDYETWTPVKGPALTWLVSASQRLRLRSRLSLGNNAWPQLKKDHLTMCHFTTIL
ncbi:MAG TPA: hypothetical protein DCZ01_08755 [Elusimicrobia bacterium]|nr:hypothetical protein [Elusimicrobiota bacterium]